MNAQDRENWDRAVQLFMEGSERYPYDPRFPWSLASLYYSRRLYRLAWDQFKKTEAILGDNAELLYQLSKTAALLNENAVSASYLERLLRLTPDNLNAVGDLGWIYYKLHRLNEGAALLLDALEFYGPDRNFSMTLGILYSDMFRYDDAKLRYLEAIAESGAVGDTVFSAVASYNLSILESRFYKYAAAADAAGASLAAADRASGHLAQGELRLRQLDLNGAFAEYQAAYERDPSPLSKLSLAQAYQAAGRLDEARLYAEDCLAQEDLSWMVNFGINPDQYRGDIHEILFNTYKGLENSERLRPCGSFAGRVQALARLVSYRFKKAVHGHLYHKYSLLTAQAYDRQGQKLDALGNYYKAFQAYRFRALDYLRQGRAYEVPLIPESLPSYETEEAGLLKKADKALALLDSFDPVWERDMSADALRIAALYGAKAQRQDAAERLYALNRGALRQEGIRLPVAVRGLAPRSALLAALNRAGFDCGGFFGGLRNNRFELRIRYNDNSLVWEIYDIQRGREALRRSLGPEELAALGSGGIRRNAALARAIADAAFRQ
jgi:tetratricopeptide (TPR) repeat protein